jgi:hypothetical protein
LFCADLGEPLRTQRGAIRHAAPVKMRMIDSVRMAAVVADESGAAGDAFLDGGIVRYELAYVLLSLKIVYHTAKLEQLFHRALQLYNVM